MTPYKIIVDAKRLKTYGTNAIEVKQGDKDSRIVNATITDDGVPLDLTGKTVTFYATKPDKTKIFNSTTIKKASDGEIEFKLTTQVLVIEGTVKGELVVFGADGYKLTSALFIIEVIKSINDESAIESQNEFTLLKDALTKLTTWDNQFETKYNGLEAEYAEDITSVKSQLADITLEKISKGEVSVKDLNKNLGKLDQTYMTDEFLQQITGNTPVNATPGDKSITSEKISDKAIHYNHLEFANRKELFDGNYINDFVIGTNEGNVPPNDYPNSVAFIVKIKPHHFYTIEKGESNRFRLGAFSVFPTKGSIGTWGYVSDLENTYSFIAGENEKFLAVQVSAELETPYLSIVEHRLKIDIEQINNTITPNLFDGNYSGFAIQETDGQLAEYYNNPESQLPTSIGYPFLLTQGETYYIKKHSASDRFRVATYSAIKLYSEPIRILTVDDSLNEFSFTAEEGENYCYVQVSGSQEYPELSISNNGFLTHSKTGALIPLSNIDIPDDFLKQNEKESVIKLSGDFNKLYISEVVDDVATDNLLYNQDINFIYDSYDVLMTTYPNFIEKNLLGYGTSETGTEDSNLPIYEYIIKPPSSLNMDSPGYGEVGDREYITLLITTGVHGTEKNSVWSLYNFIKQMLENYKTDDALGSIQANVLFKIIPIVNTGGFNNNTYNNNRDVNVNQNYSYNWENTGDGVSPYSEFESQLVRDWFENSNDKDIYIDFHGFTSSIGVNQVSYHFSHNDELNNMYATFIRRLSNSWKDRLFMDYESNESLGYINSGYSDRPSASVEFSKTYNFKLSSLIEMRWILPISNIPRYGQPLIIGGVELIANYLLALITRYYQ